MGDEPEVADPVRTRERRGLRSRPPAPAARRSSGRGRGRAGSGPPSRGRRRRPRVRGGSVRAGSRTGARRRSARSGGRRGATTARAGSARAARSAPRRAAGRAARSTRRGVRGRRRERSASRRRRPPRDRWLEARRASRSPGGSPSRPTPRERARMIVTRPRRSGRRTSSTLPENAASASWTSAARPLSTTASLPHAPRASTSSQFDATVAVPASGSPAASEEAAQVDRVRRCSSRRQPVGEEPCERRVDPELGCERLVLAVGLRRVAAGARDGAQAGCSSACARAR